MSTSRPQKNVLRSAALLAAITIGTTSAQAQNFDFTITPGNSFSHVTGPYDADIDTTVRGNYDALLNPGGTRTINGFAGGTLTSNEDVPVGVNINGNMDYHSVPTGALTVNIDTNALTFDMTCLNVDLYTPGSSIGTQNLLMQLFAFRTFAPSSTYLPLGPVPMTVGDADIVRFNIIQSGPTLQDSMIQQGAPNQYRFSSRVPVTVYLDITVQGSPVPLGVIPIGPFESILPLEGDFFVNGATATMDVDIQSQSHNQNTINASNLISATDLPFAAPTILPTGLTANLLLSASLGAHTFDLLFDANWEADGVPSTGHAFSTYCTPDPNSTGSMGELAISGSLHVSQKDILLSASNLPPGHIGYFLMSQSSESNYLPAPSQGLMCIGISTPIIRINTAPYVSWIGGSGEASFILPFDNLPDFAGLPTIILPGSTWNFQMWYRDTNPHTTSNTTNAARAQFCN
ncbi:MAG: hypothetical protein GY930_02430 [bacterium]|nr:hypothetical protein [bacterium]